MKNICENLFRITVLIFTLCFNIYIAQARTKNMDFIIPVDSSKAQNPIQSLEAVSVTSSRIPIVLAQSARLVTVMDSLAIATTPAESINDLLKYIAGVDVRQRGDMGVQTDISIRGGTFDQITILLNGINICDPQTGHNSADFPVDIHEIERIEIIEGPASRVYGTNSLVGAINIVTKTQKDTGLLAYTEGGSYGFFKGGVRLNFSSDKVKNQISTSYLRSDGYSRNKNGGLNVDYKTIKAFYQGSFSGKDCDIQWHAGISNKDFGANTFYLAKFDDQFEHTFKTIMALQAETKTGDFFHFKPMVYWNLSRDRFELFRSCPDKYPFNYHFSNVWGLNLNSYVETFLGKTSFGAELRNEDIISTNLGEPLNQSITIKGTDARYQKGANRSNISFYLEHNLLLKFFTMSAGLVATKNTGNEDGFGLYPGIDMSVRFFDSWKIYASYNRSFRMPTFTELFYSVGGHESNKFLKAEKLHAFEIGTKFIRKGIRAQFNIYYHLGNDMIDWIKYRSEGSSAKWKSVNHNEINTLGEELSLNINFSEMLSRKNFFLQAINMTYNHVEQYKVDNQNNDIISKYTLEYLRNKFVLQADFKIWKGLNFNLLYRLNDRVGSYEKFENGVGTAEFVKYSPYSVLDAGLSWNFENWRCYVEVDNLFNKKYFDFGNIPQPGIWAKCGIVYNLTYKKKNY